MQTSSNESMTVALLPQHLDCLRKAGLSDETIEACRFESVDDHAALARLLNSDERTVPKKFVPALVIPYRTADGKVGYLRLRPDNPRSRKGVVSEFEVPQETVTEVYVPPNTEVQSLDPIHIVIGEVAAARADQEGFPTLGLIDPGGWRQDAYDHLVPTLEEAPWNGRSVYVIFNSGVEGNEPVRSEEARLCKQLQDRGAEVKVVRLPAGSQGERIGVAEYLNEHGADKFRELLESAREPDTTIIQHVKSPSRLMDAAEEAEYFLQGWGQDGTSRLRFWRDNFYFWSDGAYQELSDSDMRNRAIRHLNDRFNKLTRTPIDNFLDQVRAQAELPRHTVPPTWLARPNRDWESDKLLVTKEGIYYLPSLAAGVAEYIPHTPRLFALNTLDYRIAGSVSKPKRFLEFLDQVWPNDPESIDCLQEWFGYLLTPDTSLQKILMIVGPKRSGKGTIARVLSKLLGSENVASPTLADLGGSFGLQGMDGKTVAFIHDARLSARTDRAIVTERLLSISGEDTLDITRKLLPTLTSVRLLTRLVMFTNELPRFSDSSGALASRFDILQIKETFYNREDPHLIGKLLKELPGILLWAVEGWKRLNDRDPKRIVLPQSSLDVLREMDEMGSPVGAFVNDCCELPQSTEERDNHRVPVKELYAAFRRWSTDRGASRCLDEVGFGKDLRSVLPKLDRKRVSAGGSRSWVYVGIKLREESKPDRGQSKIAELTAEENRRIEEVCASLGNPKSTPPLDPDPEPGQSKIAELAAEDNSWMDEAFPTSGNPKPALLLDPDPEPGLDSSPAASPATT